MIAALIDGAIKRRKVVLAVTLIGFVFGLVAYLSLPRESNPDIPVPYIAVTIPYPGVSPEDSERLLVRPLENELQTLEGLKEMNAVAMPNAAVVLLEFEVNFKKDKVLQDVRAKVDLARGKMPAEALPPVIEENNVNDNPVLTVILSGSAPERALHQTATALQRKLEGTPGVLRADLNGGREEMMEVTIDPMRMQAYNITTSDLAQVIGRNNQLIPAGDLTTRQGQFAVKVPGVIQGTNDVLTLPIKKNGDRIITLGDIGEVRRTFKESQRITHFNGQPAFAIDVVKRSGQNILDTVTAVRKAVGEEQARWPATIKVDYTYDESDEIKQTLTLLESGLISATILVMIIIVASLGIRSGLMVGAAIPACFMLAFLLLQANHVTLNQMVMFGLVLAVGILVDGGIVVVEYADRKMAEGMDKEQAFAAAGKRMFWPVINGTLTTLCAFLPFLFWNSIPGKFMSFLPITLFFVLGSSIFVALIFTPALGSIFGRSQGVDEHHLAEIAKSEHGDPREMDGFMGWYARALTAVSHRPGMMIGIALALVVAIGTWFGTTKHRVEFFLDQDPDHASVYVQARGNLSVEAQDQLVHTVEGRLQNIKGVESIYVRAGRTNSLGFGGPPNDSIGRIALNFEDFQHLKALGLTGRDIVAEIRKRVADIPGLGIEVRLPQGGPTPGKDVQIQLLGYDNVALNKAADTIKAKMASDHDLIELEDSRASPGIEWDIAVDRVAAGRYGVDVSSVGQAIQFVTDGILVGKFRPDDAQDELDIRVRFPADSRSLAAFDQLMISTPSGPVPASYFVKRVAAQQVTAIQRRDGQRLVILQANARPGAAANQIIGQLKPWIDKAPIDNSVRWKFRGGDEESQKASAFFVGAMITSLFLMSIILLWQFNSFYGVVVTLSAVILSTVGVLLGVQVNLFHTFDYVSVIMLGTGVVALAGVVVGHNIVLVDTFYQLRKTGMNAEDASVRAATQRFRPVMLTTVVTVIGLLPLMFQIDPSFRTAHIEYHAPGSEWWVQLAGAVVWGLTFSTLLTLVLTPVLLAAPQTMSRRFAKLWAWVRRRPYVPKTRPQVVQVPEAAE